MKLFLGLLAAALLSGNAFAAAVVNAAAAVDNGLSYAGNGGDLDTTVRVYVGAFANFTNDSIGDAQIAAGVTQPGFLNTQFSSFAAPITIGTGVGGIKGHFSNGFSNSGTVATFTGKQVYLLVVAATDYTTTASTFNTATQIGIFYAVDPSNWVFPSDLASKSIELRNLTQSANHNLLDATKAHIVVGSFGGDTSDQPPNANNFQLAIVPEPGSALLMGLGVLALGLRRRRA